MIASILSIGDEILNGQTVNTNASWMASALNEKGIEVRAQLTVADTLPEIENGLKYCQAISKLVFITGGLGATKDDITKKAIATFFDVELEDNAEVKEKIEAWFTAKGKTILDRQKLFYHLPKGAIIHPNRKGLAQGMELTKGLTRFFFMPGVPYEMQCIMTDSILPQISVDGPIIEHLHIMTAGTVESKLSELLDDFEESLPDYIKLAYLPSPGIVKLRLTERRLPQSDSALKSYYEILQKLVKKHTYSNQLIGLNAAVGSLLQQKDKTLSLAESCTGGYLSHLITKESGASKHFMGSVVAYSNTIKENQLQVPASIIEEHGAVSEPTVEAMVKGCLKLFNTDYAVAISGIAGPHGGNSIKPVGTVFIGVGNKDKTLVQKYLFYNDRMLNIEIAATHALRMLFQFVQ